jgi:hypothetical protein
MGRRSHTAKMLPKHSPDTPSDARAHNQTSYPKHEPTAPHHTCRVRPPASLQHSRVSESSVRIGTWIGIRSRSRTGPDGVLYRSRPVRRVPTPDRPIPTRRRRDRSPVTPPDATPYRNSRSSRPPRASWSRHTSSDAQRAWRTRGGRRRRTEKGKILNGSVTVRYVLCLEPTRARVYTHYDTHSKFALEAAPGRPGMASQVAI